VATVRDGLLVLRAQIDTLLGQVDRLHQPRRARSIRP
jgi:hypothetical protein